MVTHEIITVGVVDDHPAMRRGIRAILEQAPGIEVVGEASDGTQAMALVAQFQPRILLLDIEMPGPRACDVEKWVRTHYPATITLVLTAHNYDAYLADMVEAGAQGFLLKEIDEHYLVKAIHRAVEGELLLTGAQLERIQRWRQDVGEKWGSLTARERAVVRLVTQGRRNSDIAQSLGIAEHTVETHLGHALHKLALSNRTELTTWVLQHKLAVEDPNLVENHQKKMVDFQD